MLLDLATDVLRQLVDRVGHLGRCLAGSQGYTLQSQGGLGDLSVFYRGIALFGNLDIEGCKLRDLFADPPEALQDVLPQFVGYLDVAPTYLDPHIGLLDVVSRCYAPTDPGGKSRVCDWRAPGQAGQGRREE